MSAFMAIEKKAGAILTIPAGIRRAEIYDILRIGQYHGKEEMIKMAKKSELLTSSEFSLKAGIPASTVSKLIRDGKIKAVKKSGKWMIDPDQLKAKAVTEATKKSKPTVKKKPAKSAPQKAAAKIKKPSPPKAATPAKAQKTFTIAEFAEMTYLTEKGVGEWLKCGRLAGHQDDTGNWRIDAANLDAPDVKRLVR